MTNKCPAKAGAALSNLKQGGIAILALGAIGLSLLLRFEIGTTVPIISIAADGSWATWVGVQPAIAAGPSAPTSVPAANRKPTELCAGLPRLPAGPQVLEITTTTGPPDALAVAGWRNSAWRDGSGGPQPISDLQLVGRSDGLGVGFLQRRNGLAWPSAT